MQVKAFQANKQSRVYAINDNCIGCGQCAKKCPVDAIVVAPNAAGKKKATVQDKCVGCGICFKVCPINKKAETDDKKAVSMVTPAKPEKVICQTCPIHCCIGPGENGSCQRYTNVNGVIERNVPYQIVNPDQLHLDPKSGLPDFPIMLGYGAGTNLYSTDVPAKVITSRVVDGVEIVSCVTETVLSFNGARVKIDTDEFIGNNGTPVKRDGMVVGFINTAEYGSQMIHIGGSHLNTSADGHWVLRTTCDLLNKKPVTLKTDTVNELVIQHGHPPIFDGVQAQRMRIGCGTVGATTFTREMWGEKIVDEVITIDYDITSKMSAHTTAGVRYGYPDSGITPVGRYSSQGRYFGIPGNGWGGSNVMCARDAIASIDKNVAWPGLRLAVIEPTAVRCGYFELDENLEPVEKPVPEKVMKVLEWMRSECEPCNCTVTVVSGFGGGIRDTIVRNDSLAVNRALRSGKCRYTINGQPCHIWPGGGITAEADVTYMPEGSFTWVPTPASVCPMEVTMTRETYAEMGGYMDAIVPVEELMKNHKYEIVTLETDKTLR